MNFYCHGLFPVATDEEEITEDVWGLKWGPGWDNTESWNGQWWWVSVRLPVQQQEGTVGSDSRIESEEDPGGDALGNQKYVKYGNILGEKKN